MSAVEENSGAIGVNGDESDNSAPDSGAVYVFVKQDGVWEKQAYLKASNTGADDWFGEEIAISGDTIVVSALAEDSSSTGVNGDENNNSSLSSGAAYVFFRENGMWSQQAYLKASNTSGINFFGRKVAISGDIIVVTSEKDDSNATGVNGDDSNRLANGSGAAFVFARDGSAWQQQAYLKASNTKEGMAFGSSVDISDNTIVIGAKFEDMDINGNEGDFLTRNSGAAYVFVFVDGMWRQEAYLKSSNPGRDDYFGNAVAVSGDTLVVSALNEDSSAKGVNGSENNEESKNSGAAYIFNRIEGEWIQQAYFKASNADPFDQFGVSVAISGDTVVVGAENEDSNAIGINNNEIDNSSIASGAIYIFNRIGDMWMQSHYVKTSNSDAEDLFGFNVVIDGSTIASGSVLEDSNATGVEGDQLDNSIGRSGAAYVFELNQGFELQAGHSALWYNQDQNGHGINVYMLANNRIIVIWYVYDSEGNQVWLLGVGTHDGAKATLDVTIHDGAMFPPDFDSVDVNTVSWGQFELEFSGCNDGLFKWMPIADNGFAAGETNVIRLNTTLGLTCVDSNTKSMELPKIETLDLKAGEFAMQAGHSALWYNPEQNGHGINVYMLADNRIIVIWYVYDSQGNQVWLLGIGNHDGQIASLNVTIHNGAMFPPDFNANDVNTVQWGSFELEFNDCDTGLFKWIPVEGNGFAPGETSVVRLNSTLGLSCTN